MVSRPVIGVLALQGAFAAHADALRQLGSDVREIRQPAHLDSLDGIVLPGGESTTMSNLLISSGLHDPLTQAIRDGLPVFGTCAGLILLASNVLDGRADQVNLSALHATVRRNGYGRQVDSFETDLVVTGLDSPFHAVFIRAPIIEDFDRSIEVLASLNDQAVLVRQESIMACSFHPELSGDNRIHRIFIQQLVQQTTRHHKEF